MYKISVPVMNENLTRNGREETLRELRRLNAERVFLALGTYELDECNRQKVMNDLAENCRFFKAHGFEVGSWIWAFWVTANRDFRCMRKLDGEEDREFMCPTDENFVRYSCDYIADIARCGVDIIMFDDDFRYGIRGDTPCCLCDGHIEAINRITGVESTREELAKYIQSGEQNKFRDAFLQVNGDSFRSFSHAVRGAVDSVNPDIRMGLCCCMSTWDLDGTDAYELSLILAGNTKPFTRLIGAPYWATSKAFVKDVPSAVEMERMESAWTRKGEIEIMAEGDVYPRPRSSCPAAYLEIFDTAIRASGCTDGILKYGIDYCSHANYETGYADRHERNKPLYAGIDRLFGGKQSCGVRVFEPMKKIADMVCPTAVNDRVSIDWLMFPKAAFMLSYNSIPTTYEGDGVCGICFDESARALPLDMLKNGWILDIAAAEILTARGVDVGLESIGAPVRGATEHFFDSDCHILTCGAVSYEIKLKPEAEVLSETDISSDSALASYVTKNKNTVPTSYRYENADGARFLVLNFNTRTGSDHPLRHYARSKQLSDNIAWLGGKKLPAYSYGNPSLYIQTKKGADGSMAVGLWNFFEDFIIAPVVELDRAYTSIEFVNCKGRLEGDKVILEDLPAFGIACFEVK